MSNSEIRIIEKICYPILRIYNYPLHNEKNKSPAYRKINFKKLKATYRLHLLKLIFNFRILWSIIFGDRTLSETFRKSLNILKTLKNDW